MAEDAPIGDVPEPPRGPGNGALTRLLEAIAHAPSGGLPSSDAPGLNPGTRVGRFEVVREIGRGGFGAVYEAVDGELGRHVALKLIRPGLDRGAQLDEDLRQEAENTARLEHPHIVTLFDAGRSEHGPFLVMELLHGETLARRLARGPVPVAEGIRIGIALAEALAHAHARGVLHRDLKPGNVFITEDGRVKVLDFGLAHLLGREAGRPSGTPGYAPPEQWAGQPLDGSADVFASGAVLYELATCHRPPEVAATAGDGEGPPPLVFPLGWPRRFTALVTRCLAAAPAQRPPDGQALLDDLRVIERRHARRRTLRRAGALATLAVLLGALLAVGLTRGHPGAPARHLAAVAEAVDEGGAPEALGITGLVTSALESSPRLRLLPRVRLRELLRAAGLPADVGAETAPARLALAAAGVRTLFVPLVGGEGANFTVGLQVLDLERDEESFLAREPMPHREGVPAAVDRLARRARAALGEDEASLRGEAGVAAAMAARLDAWALYDRGRRLAASFQQAEAIQFYLRAVELDPAMAPAQFQLAYQGYQWALMDFDRIKIAARHLDRAAPRERDLIRAFAALHDGRVDEAWSLAQPVAARFPDDPEVAFFAGVLAGHAGDEEAAAAQFGRAVELQPGSAWMRASLAETLVGLRRGPEARAAVKGAGITAAEADAGLAAVQFQLGQREDGVAAARRALAAEPDDLRTRLLLSTALAVQGEVEAHRREVTSARMSTLPGIRALAPSMEALGLTAMGRFRAGLKAFDEGWRAPWIHPERRAAFRTALLAAAGEDALAREEAGRVRLWSPAEAVALFRIGAADGLRSLASHMVPGSAGAALTGALLAWHEGDSLSALRILRAADRRGRGWVSLVHGELAAELGYDEEALEAFAEIEGVVLFGREEAGWLAESARAELLAGRCRERLGRRAEARAGLEALLHRWHDADEEHVLVREARALCQRLGCRAP